MGSKVQGNKEGPLKLAHSPLRPDLGDTVGAAGQGRGRGRWQSLKSHLPPRQGQCSVCTQWLIFEAAPSLPLGLPGAVTPAPAPASPKLPHAPPRLKEGG